MAIASEPTKAMRAALGALGVCDVQFSEFIIKFCPRHISAPGLGEEGNIQSKMDPHPPPEPSLHIHLRMHFSLSIFDTDLEKIVSENVRNFLYSH